MQIPSVMRQVGKRPVARAVAGAAEGLSPGASGPAAFAVSGADAAGAAAANSLEDRFDDRDIGNAECIIRAELAVAGGHLAGTSCGMAAAPVLTGVQGAAGGHFTIAQIEQAIDLMVRHVAMAATIRQGAGATIPA